jgi:acetyl-CoA acetyltransferase
MRDVAVVSFAQSPSVRSNRERNEVEILMPVVREAMERSGIARGEIGFTCSGSSDYLAGQPFAFVNALDAVGAWPPIEESHVEMDGAWALYEAWVRLQHGDIDAALVYCFGKSSLGDLRRTLVLQLDPYYVAPLWPDPIALAALQARALIDRGRFGEADFAEVAARSRSAAAGNPMAQLREPLDGNAALAEPYIAPPLRRHDCPPVSDGAAAVVLAAGALTGRACERPAWIRGIDHRIEPASLGARDLAVSPSAALAARASGADRGADVAELHAPFSPQELILREAMSLGVAAINPSGGALTANPMMAAGLIRIGEAARRIHDGSARRAVAHATSGPCLQQNLVCVMEAA